MDHVDAWAGSKCHFLSYRTWRWESLFIKAAGGADWIGNAQHKSQWLDFQDDLVAVMPGKAYVRDNTKHRDGVGFKRVGSGAGACI